MQRVQQCCGEQERLLEGTGSESAGQDCAVLVQQSELLIQCEHLHGLDLLDPFKRCLNMFDSACTAQAAASLEEVRLHSEQLSSSPSFMKTTIRRLGVQSSI